MHAAPEPSPQTTAKQLIESIRGVALELKLRPEQIESIDLDTTLDTELGLDSLTRAEFISRIGQKFELTFPQQVFTTVSTPRELLREVLAAQSIDHNAPIAKVDSLVLDKVDPSPATAQTLLDILDWHVQTHPERPHIQIYEAGESTATISYQQLKREATRIAAGLQAKGLNPKQAVAIMLPTCKEYFYTFFGILIAGGIPVPIYPPARLNQVEDHLLRHKNVLSNCSAVMLITVDEAIHVARLVKPHVRSLHSIVTPEEICADPASVLYPNISSADIAFLQYTSGSTGTPKGVTLTHANLLANIRSMGQKLQIESTDTFVSWLPLYHDMGLIGAWFGNFYYSALLVIMSPLDFLAKPDRWLNIIHQTKATLSAAPNFAYELSIKRSSEDQIKNLDLSNVRALFNGAEPVSPNTMEKFADHFAPTGLRRSALYAVYGLAECSLGLTFPPLARGPLFDVINRDTFMETGFAKPEVQKSNSLRFVSCGTPIPNHELRILDDSGRELPDRRQGRLQFRGPSTTSGYYRNPEKTRELFHGEWLNSGDLAYVADGEVYLTGRVKDLIIRAGRNIYPQEIEEAVSNISGIRKGCVAVFGSSHSESGTEKLIVLAETRITDSEEKNRLGLQINQVATKLIGGAPDEVLLVRPHTVLKTSSGKIRRSGCRDLFEKNLLEKGPASPWIQFSRLLITAGLSQINRIRDIAFDSAYAIYSWIIFSFITIISWPVVVCCPSLLWRLKFIRAAIRTLARLTGTKITLQGTENLPSTNTTNIFVSNHCSYLDAAVLFLALPLPFSFVAKNDLLKQFFATTFLRRIGTEFVARYQQQQGITDSENVTAAVNNGKSILVFPEGTFTRMPGLLPFYMGAFKTAAETDTPIIPVIIHGTRSILRSDTWFPRKGAVTISILPKVESLDRSNSREVSSNWEHAQDLKDTTRKLMLKHLREPDLCE